MNRLKILIIAGHGQGDPGAVNNGYQEAKLVREIAPILRNKLKPYADVTVFDMDINMYKYLKSHSFDFTQYDYVIELHFNANKKETVGNGKTVGVEILVHTSEKGTSVENAIISNISALGFTDRGIKRRSNLRNMNRCKGQQGVSYALIEICFIDDIDDMKLYNAKKDAVISGIANGVISGFGLKKTTLTEPRDIINRLSQDIQIDDINGAVSAVNKAKKENSPLYWLLYKVVNK